MNKSNVSIENYKTAAEDPKNVAMDIEKNNTYKNNTNSNIVEVDNINNTNTSITPSGNDTETNYNKKNTGQINNKNNNNNIKENNIYKNIELYDKHKLIIFDTVINIFYIICLNCQNKISLKNKDIFLLNNQNFLCNNITCNKYNYLSICPQCKTLQQFLKYNHEGDIITCVNCSLIYYQFLCPVSKCSEMNYSPLKNFSNIYTSNGVIYKHTHNNQKIEYQKISCYFCLRPIVYLSEGNRKNLYFESMPILCPYKDCGKKFNRLICTNPQCTNIIIIKSGLYRMGMRIKCDKCSKSFGKIICPKCLKVNPLEKNSFKYGEFECRYKNCSKKTNIAVCIHCERINYFPDLPDKIKELIPGLTLTCGYEGCSKNFSMAFCPGCHHLNPFPNGDFAFGHPYKCKYTAKCTKYFLLLICPHCGNYSRMTEQCEGKKYNCNDCKTLLANFQCPFCRVNILDENSSFNLGQMIPCPNESCKKLFSFFRCYSCQFLIYSEENECVLGKPIECKNCLKTSINVICTHCKSKITYARRSSRIMEGEEIHCPHCQQDFRFGDKLGDEYEKIYANKLVYIPPIQGKPIMLGKPQIDENYIARRKLISDDDNNNNICNRMECELKKETKKKDNLCIICQSKEKESIFFRCGHRCTCYECAVYYFETHKKCPKCFHNAEAIIRKIYYV